MSRTPELPPVALQRAVVIRGPREPGGSGERCPLGRTLSSGRGALAAAALAAVLLAAPQARADESEARRIFQSMSDYLAAQKTFSFDFDASLDVVTKEGQKITLASSGSATVERPDKIRATRTGGFADVEIVFDGKTATLIGRNANAYAQLDIPGSLDNLVDTLRDTYHRPLPAADLLMSDVSGQLLPLVTDVKDLGSGVIGGVECDHLAFRSDDVDWQIWIAQGDRPYPCRYTITSKQVAGFPEYTIVVKDWKSGAEVAGAGFAPSIPAGATRLEASGISDDLPSHFTLGDAK